jgi:hypothetical protein
VSIHKDFRVLAERVNTLEDWTAELAQAGAHAGRAYVVRHEGEFVCRVSGNPSHPQIALRRAEAELRRLGCPLPRGKTTAKKEDTMPAPSADEYARCEALLPRARKAIQLVGTADQLVDLAIEVARDSGQSLKSRSNVKKSFQRFLDGKGLIGDNLARFELATAAILDAANGAAPALEEPAPELEPEPELETTVDKREQLFAQLKQAEDMLAVHRDPYIRARDEVQLLRLELIELLQDESGL